MIKTYDLFRFFDTNFIKVLRPFLLKMVDENLQVSATISQELVYKVIFYT